MKRLVASVLLVACWRSSPPPPATEPPPNPAPAKAKAPPGLRITGLEPAKGHTDGGTYVVLKGDRFLADGPRNAKVYFGPRQGTIVRFASDDEMIVQAPGGKDGEIVDILVIFDPGGQLKLPGAFTFVDPTQSP